MNPDSEVDQGLPPIEASIVAPYFFDSIRYHAMMLLGSLGVLVVAAVLQLSGTEGVRLPGMPIPLPEICYAKQHLGITCPGCGLTRSTICMIRGDLVGAFQFNPMGPVIFAIIVFQIPFRAWAIQRLRRGMPAEFPWTNTIAVVVLTGLILQWVVRLIG